MVHATAAISCRNGHTLKEAANGKPVFNAAAVLAPRQLSTPVIEKMKMYGPEPLNGYHRPEISDPKFALWCLIKDAASIACMGGGTVSSSCHIDSASLLCRYKLQACIDQVMQLGYTFTSAENAARMAGADVQTAAQLLLDDGAPHPFKCVEQLTHAICCCLHCVSCILG